MKLLNSYPLAENSSLEFYVEGTKNILPYDDLIIKYTKNQKKWILYHDFMIEGFRVIQRKFPQLLTDSLELDSMLFNQGIGYRWNQISHEIAEGNFDVENSTGSFMLWSMNAREGVASWVYNLNGEIFLEITPYYPWNYDEPDDEDDYITFQQFQKEYRKIDCIRLTKNMAGKILSDSEKGLLLIAENINNYKK